MALTWENVDRAAGEIRIFTSKNGEGRVLPMDDTLAELVERRWIAREYEQRPGETAIGTWIPPGGVRPGSPPALRPGRSCRQCPG